MQDQQDQICCLSDKIEKELVQTLQMLQEEDQKRQEEQAQTLQMLKE